MFWKHLEWQDQRDEVLLQEHKQRMYHRISLVEWTVGTLEKMMLCMAHASRVFQAEADVKWFFCSSFYSSNRVTLDHVISIKVWYQGMKWWESWRWPWTNTELGIGLFVIQTIQFGLSKVRPCGISVYLDVLSHCSAILKQLFSRELWRAHLSWGYKELASASPNVGLMSWLDQTWIRRASRPPLINAVCSVTWKVQG